MRRRPGPSASQVSDTSATLEAYIHSDAEGTGNEALTWWFEYGPTPAFGSTTPEVTSDVPDRPGALVAATVTGLDEGTPTTSGPASAAGCAAGPTFTTTSERARCTASACPTEIPDAGYHVGASVDVSRGARRVRPRRPGIPLPGRPLLPLPDEGVVTCLRVDGNRASIGFLADYTMYDPSLPLFPVVIYIEDVGATADRFATELPAEVADLLSRSRPALDAPGADRHPGRLRGARPPVTRWSRLIGAGRRCCWSPAATTASPRRPATSPTPALRLQGIAYADDAETLTWWFEYGPTWELGSTTPEQTHTTPFAGGSDVEATITGLDEATTYLYRTCVRNSPGRVLCGAWRCSPPRPGATRSRGAGSTSIPPCACYLGASADVSAEAADGTDLEGSASVSPGSLRPYLADEGPATCLRVAGSRAVVGFIGDLSAYGEPQTYWLLYIDDGPTGDRFWSVRVDAEVDGVPRPDGGAVRRLRVARPGRQLRGARPPLTGGRAPAAVAGSTDQPPLTSWTGCLPAEIHGIIAAELLADLLDLVLGALLLRSALKLARPVSLSATHSSAKRPSWISSRILRISAFTASLMMRGPRVRSPYSAVSEIE